MIAYRRVTFTRCGFELSASKNANAAISSGDHSGFFEQTKNVRYRRTANAEHDGKKLLLQRKVIGVDSIVNLQQPTAAALRDVVQRVTGRALHRLQESRLRVRGHERAKHTVNRRLSEERRRGQRDHWTVGHLLQRSS